MTSKVAQTRSEQALSLLRSGYLFASRVRRRAGVSADSGCPVRMPLLGKQTVLVRGEEGVKLFYDTSRVQRDGAMPEVVKGPLFGSGAVHGLDGEAHRVRKNQLADMAYEDERVAEYKPLVAEELAALAQRWQGGDNVYDSTAIAFGRASFRWAGIPWDTQEMDRWAHRMSRLLDTFGRPATQAVAWADRIALDRRFAKLIRDVRSGAVAAPEDSVLAHMAELVDEHGALVDEKTAGIELQNLTRPNVAVARFAAFAATALVEHPEWIERIRAASRAQGGTLLDVPEAVAFAQEVRRVYPFVPVLPAEATVDTEVQGCPVHKGQRILLDILGTNTDPASWDRAATFDPERFMGVADAEAITTFIPQGGADVRTGHRCPGEKIAVTSLSAAVVALCRPEVQLPSDQDDLTFSWTHMLTRPATGVRVRSTR
ncbi:MULTISPECIES: cytochrome P450 [Kocuria]|uniref:Cytochrome P450 n=1 Tax=Kocuria tytonis TaxID=2054280 RepID=A0A495A7P0_9MICC|nr:MULTISPECIES: cytochrome P450 [Kocuria]RKQ35346.1 cytochrome P450 [Kocuria tytonis]